MLTNEHTSKAVLSPDEYETSWNDRCDWNLKWFKELNEKNDDHTEK